MFRVLRVLGKGDCTNPCDTQRDLGTGRAASAVQDFGLGVSGLTSFTVWSVVAVQASWALRRKV